MKKLLLLTLLTYYRIYLNLLFFISPNYGTRKAFKLFATPFHKRQRDQENEVLKRAEKYSIEIRGTKIATYRWGSGPKMVMLVHGWEGNAGSLGGFVEPLVRNGYTVIAFDGPAHGYSEGKRTDVFHFSGFISELLHQYTPDVILSHSFGSAAVTYALSNMTTLKLKRLVMLTTPDRLEDIIHEFTRIMRLNSNRKQLIFKLIEETYGIPVSTMQVSQLIKDLPIEKTLIMHSEDDKILDFQGAKRVAQHAPHAVFKIPEIKGHYKVLWDKKTIDQVMEFVQPVNTTLSA